MSKESYHLRKPKVLPKPGSVKVVRALYSYTAQYEDELSFHEGDILYVFDRSNSEWWKARIGLKSGLIPSNHVDEKFDELINPLHEAARRGNLNFLKECLNQNVSSTSLDSMGNTPLHWAAYSGHMDCVRNLLNQPNAPLTAQNQFGDTALHRAAARNHVDIVQILLEAGSNPNLLNNNGETPEQIAGISKIKNIFHLYKSNEDSKKLTRVTSEEYEDESD